MKKQTHHKKTLLIILATLLVVIIGYFTYAFVSKAIWPFATTDTAPSYQQDETTPGDQRTTEDEAESQDAKKRLIQREDTPLPPQDTNRVTISSAEVIDNSVEVRAFTDSVIEPGECVITFTNASETKRFTQPAFIDARSTICEPLRIDTSSLSSGIWNVTVTITTTTTEGTSAAIEVQL